jgi:hypothetical protein
MRAGTVQNPSGVAYKPSAPDTTVPFKESADWNRTREMFRSI